MNAHPNKLDKFVEYSADAVIFESKISDITTHHETFHHIALYEIIHLVKGEVRGEFVRHNNGDTIDYSQFE